MGRTQWKTSTFTRIVAAILATSLAPLAIGLYFVAQFLIQYETDNYIESMRANLKQADAIIQERVRLLKQTAANLGRNSGIMILLDEVTPETGDAQVVDILRNRTIPALENARVNNWFASSIRLIHGNSRVFDVYDRVCYVPQVETGEWRERLHGFYLDDEDPLRVAYVGPVGPDADYFGYGPRDADKRVLPVYAGVFSPRDNRLLGVVEVTMTLDTLTQPLANVPVNEGEALQLVDREGRVLSASSPTFGYLPEVGQAAGQGTEIQWQGQGYRMYFQRVSSIDGWLIQYIPAHMAGIEKYKLVIGAMLLVTGCVFSVMCATLYRLFSGNIRKLIRGIRKVQAGDLDARVDIATKDEFGEIAAQLNEMTCQIKQLLNREKLAGQLEKQAIYKALESQMKPHFLCNALDFIRMSTRMAGDEEIAQSVGLIMEYVNYNMNRKHMTVSIRDELQNVEDFIGIYNLINRNRIQYTIDMAPDIADQLDSCTIIKYALQPIVENAVKHAFRRKEGACFISLELAFAQAPFGRAISIGIEDNGDGMETSQAEALNQSLRGGDNDEELLEGKDYGGIGLKNIYQRMRMAYGGCCDLTIESYPKVGTKITLMIPPRSFGQRQVIGNGSENGDAPDAADR